jgi:hypothetical protein
MRPAHHPIDKLTVDTAYAATLQSQTLDIIKSPGDVHMQQPYPWLLVTLESSAHRIGLMRHRDAHLWATA